MKGKKLSHAEFVAKLDRESTERKKLFKQLCDHVATGYSVDSFYLVGDTTIDRFFKTYPEDFVREDFELAKRKGKANWESIGYRQSTGECLGNSRSWYYNMANRYGWKEKLDVEAEHKGNVNVSVINYATSKQPSDKDDD